MSLSAQVAISILVLALWQLDVMIAQSTSGT